MRAGDDRRLPVNVRKMRFGSTSLVLLRWRWGSENMKNTLERRRESAWMLSIERRLRREKNPTHQRRTHHMVVVMINIGRKGYLLLTRTIYQVIGVR